MRIDRIKFATELLRQDLTQKRLSELSGVSRVTISAIKVGKSCSPEVARKLADALKVDLKSFLSEWCVRSYRKDENNETM